MCKYYSECDQCSRSIEISATCENMQDVKINISSACPKLDNFTDNSITLDGMRELIVQKEKSTFIEMLQNSNHPFGCTIYESVIDALGRELARYYEIA